MSSAMDWDRFWAEEDRLVLAPMEGVVDWVMRDLITRVGGVDLCVTEFIRVTDQILPEATFFKDCPELPGSGFKLKSAAPLAQMRVQMHAQTRAGVPVLVQLLGGKPEFVARNAALAAALGAPGIDLNFGCPAKTVNRHDGGAALLKEPSRIFDVVKAVRAAVPAHLPVSAKVRLGFSNKDRHLDIARAAEEGGAAWLTVHARTRDEGYRPPAHWSYIGEMREALKIPVIANGDVWTLDDYRRCREVTGCRHVMIGRGMMSHPSLALEIKKAYAGDAGTDSSTWGENLQWLQEFGRMSRDFRTDHYAVCRTKQLLKNVSRRFADQGPALFERIKRFEELDLILDAMAAEQGL